MKVIVVDDEEMKTLVDDLSEYESFGPGNVLKFGYDISIVKEFLLEKGDEIDVAIIDQFIGEHRGTDFGAWINSQFPHVICILLTGGGPDRASNDRTLLNICKDSMEKGFTAFMLKSHECSDKKNLFESLDRILQLPSIEGKRKAKRDKLQAKTLSARMFSQYAESDTYSTEFCLHCIELIAQAHFLSHNSYPSEALYYSRCFKRIEKELQYIDLKESDPPRFSSKLLGNKHSRKRYGQKMSEIRKYFQNFKMDDLNERAKILGSVSGKANVLYMHFKKERTEEITYRLLSENPDSWKLARQHFPQVKAIVEKFSLA